MQKEDILDKSPDRIGHMFDHIAPTYDFLNHFLSFGFDIFWRKRAVIALNLSAGSNVLDVATGTGDLSFVVLKQIKELKIIGVDLSSKMLRIATRKRVKKGIPEDYYRLIKGDALSLPFKDGVFDAVMIAYGIRNIPDVEQALSEFHRVLKPKGKLLILEFSMPSSFMVRSFYLFYFKRILPFLGNLISGDHRAYNYLPESVGAFMSPHEMSSIIKKLGFNILNISSIFKGITYFIISESKRW